MSPEKLNLNGLTFQELFTVDGLNKLDFSFLSELKSVRPDLYQKIPLYRGGVDFSPIETSEFILALAPPLETFIARLFRIEKAVL
jgi:hypothetical protein